jgi:hypothetical protein
LREQMRDIVGLRYVAGVGGRTGFGGERGEFVGVTRRECDAHPVFGKQAGKRGAESRARADDKSRSLVHVASPV